MYIILKHPNDQFPWGRPPGNGQLLPVRKIDILQSIHRYFWIRFLTLIKYIITCEVVNVFTCLSSPLRCQAIGIQATLWIFSYFALRRGASAPIQVTPWHSDIWLLVIVLRLIVCSVNIEADVTGSGVFSAVARGTKWALKSGALPGTAGTLATSCHRRRLVREAAGHLAQVARGGEGSVDEIQRNRSWWMILFTDWLTSIW